jgi:uncharacterized damage-inducible protein DinB
MNLRQHLRLMAGYHLWATQRLLAEVDRVDDPDYRADRGLFFGSIHGTLNHLLVVERLWRGRLEGAASTVRSLDEELLADRGALRDALLADTGHWRGHVDAMRDDEIAGDLAYRNLQGEAFDIPRASCVLHIVNHAVHHRGQISAALTGLGANAPVMDLPYYLLELPRAALHGRA